MSQLTKRMSSISNDSVDWETMLDTALDSPVAFENDDISSKESVESVDNLLSELTKEFESEAAVGKKLGNERLPKLINKMFRSKMAEKLLKEKMEKQTRPENCANAKATLVNA